MENSSRKTDPSLKNPYNETNFKIQELPDNGGFAVRSDSERFGKNEITFQGISYKECLEYIAERTGDIRPSYYVIKDLASWRSYLWDNPPERSRIERFDTVEEAVAKFNEYKGMDYLKTHIINPDDNKPMRRLVLGVSLSLAEMDLLHTEDEKTLLLSDALGERKDGYEVFMTNSSFIDDLHKILFSVRVDEYTYYRDMTLEELAADRLQVWEESYPGEYTLEEAVKWAEMFVKQSPYYLQNHKVNERIAMKDFNPPYLKKDLSRYEELVDIYDLEYDEDGYLYFTIRTDGTELEGLYRIYDPDNGISMRLVSIECGEQHPVIGRQWDRIENALYDATLERYCDLTNDQKALAMSGIMDELGFEPVYVAGWSEDGFLMWKAKDETDTKNAFGYDDWDSVKEFVAEVRLLHEKYSLNDLRDYLNGYYGVIEYGSYNEKAVETAISSYLSDTDPALDRYEAEFGADGSRAFPNLNNPSPEEISKEFCAAAQARGETIRRKKSR